MKRTLSGKDSLLFVLLRSTSLMLSILLLLTGSRAWAQQGTITGTVSAGADHIPGVTVRIKNKTAGTLTNANGNFSIAAAPGDTLVFSHMSYQEQLYVIKNLSPIRVSLDALSKSVNEVVVVGYGTQKKATLTGSISVVKGAELVQSPQPNVSNSLTGRFPGIIANNRSGEPGYDGSRITIRGLATTGNNDVLMVVDGVPGQIGGLERLDPNDIESISILKDASAAIYGSRAANGVMLITTKQGQPGKPVINYFFNQGFSSPTRLPKMADAATYAQIMNEIQYYNNPAGGMNQFYTADQLQKFRDGSDPVNYPNTDWQKAALKKTATQTQHNLSVRGGSENIKYYLSIGMISQNGLYKNGATQYNQYNFRSNITADITSRLKVGLYLSGREEDRRFPTVGAGTIFRGIYRAYPTVLDRYPNGLPTTGIENNNPIMQGTDAGGINRNPTQVFNGILKGSYAIPGVEGLSLDGYLSADKSWNFDKNFSTPYKVYTLNKTTGAYDPTLVGGSNGLPTLSESQENMTMITSNIKLNYARHFGAHNVNAFIGYEQSKTSDELFGASRRNFPTPQAPELSQGGAAATDKDNSGSSYSFTRRSILGRLAYDYQEKYLLEVQARRDGSSTFPEGRQWGFFPSVSAGWRISNEPWFKPVTFINDLKLRGSYGSLGNDNVGMFQYFNNYSFVNQYVLNGVIQTGINLTKLANPNITWEVAKKMDLGINMTFLNDFYIEFIYFEQKRSKILTQRNSSVPQVSGIVNPYGSDPLVPAENIGKVNSGGIEAMLGYGHTTSSGFRYDISGNMTYAKNKIIFIDEAAGVLPYQRQTGRPLNTYLLYNAIGIFRTQADLDKYPHLPGAKLGDLIYEDYNGDKQITADDQVRSKYGNIPEITYGLSLNGSYKGFDLFILFAGQTHVSQYVLPESGTIGNYYSSWADNRWSPTNTNGSYPRVDERASSSVNGGRYPSTFWMNNASFLRLKNVSLGYTIHSDLLTRWKVSSLRVYANAFNLLTFTRVKDYDPEGDSGSGQFYPQQRIMNIGVNLKF